MKTLKDIEFEEHNEFGQPSEMMIDSKTLRDVVREHIKELEKGCYCEEENNLRQRAEGKISWIKMFFNIEEEE